MEAFVTRYSNGDTESPSRYGRSDSSAISSCRSLLRVQSFLKSGFRLCYRSTWKLGLTEVRGRIDSLVKQDLLNFMLRSLSEVCSLLASPVLCLLSKHKTSPSTSLPDKLHTRDSNTHAQSAFCVQMYMPAEHYMHGLFHNVVLKMLCFVLLYLIADRELSSTGRQPGK